MGRTKSEVGQIGEDIACEYLVSKGCRIIDRNVNKPWGELDIVSRAKDGILVFVEVKALQGEGGDKDRFIPEQHFNSPKMMKTRRAAQAFANHYPDLVGDMGFRIDLIAIIILDPELTDWKKDCEIRHYENV